MNPDPGSLENLQDVVEPSPVGWWPPAPGWWILGTAVLLVVLVLVIRAVLHWRSNAYRRAALRELQQAGDVASVAAILKRTAMSAAGRPQVASLSGPAWIAWLRDTSNLRLTDPVIVSLTDGVFADRDVVRLDALKEFAAEWIRTHTRRRSESSAAAPGRPDELGMAAESLMPRGG